MSRGAAQETARSFLFRVPSAESRRLASKPARLSCQPTGNAPGKPAYKPVTALQIDSTAGAGSVSRKWTPHKKKGVTSCEVVMLTSVVLQRGHDDHVLCSKADPRAPSFRSLATSCMPPASVLLRFWSSSRNNTPCDPAPLP